MQTGEQIKESATWVGRQEVSCGVQLSPRKELPNQERNGKEASYSQAVFDAFYLSLAYRNLCVLQCDTAQDQHARVEPKQRRYGQLRPVRNLHSHEVGADEEHE